MNKRHTVPQAPDTLPIIPSRPQPTTKKREPSPTPVLIIPRILTYTVLDTATFFSWRTAGAAASRATGTRKGEALT